MQKIARLREQARALPEEPGVYIMRNAAGEIIYIGKAKVLRNRVSSYFTGVQRHLPKVYKMVEQVESFSCIVATSEFEALVLECSMIKQHTPKYNILLKDDKGYSYVHIDSGPYPRITEVKTKQEDGARYIGPYMSSYVVKLTVDQANKAFMLPTCNRSFPRDLGKGRPCLNYHLKQCMGVCRGNISPEEYAEALEQAVDFIRGESSASAAALRQQMEQAAQRLEFEKAARYRDRLAALERIGQRQRVLQTGVKDQDVLAFLQGSGETAVAILKFREHKLVDKEDYLIGETGDMDEAREEFIARYYLAPARQLPPILVLDADFAGRPLVEQLLQEKQGRRVQLRLPQRGEQARLVEMAALNAAERLSQAEGRSVRELAALEELARLLGLAKPPAYIESYDISNIGGQEIVGGMVVFENGRPLKKAYKRFAIREVVGAPDDYASMREMLRRRFERYRSGDEPEDSSFKRLPDLVLVDGGAGQLAVAQQVLGEFGLQLPLFGMVKDDRHRTRAIAADGGEIAFSALRRAFALVTAIQDETHRWAVGYARQKHKKTSLELAILNVPGIGPARARALYSHFKTQKALHEATCQQLADVKGMNQAAAAALFGFLHADDPAP